MWFCQDDLPRLRATVQQDPEAIVAVSRTAWGDSHNFHDANYLTFHRINDFRKLVH
jgi:hypothetical protein